MAIVKATNSKASISKAINYVTKEEKTEEKLISGINCIPETALDEMNATKEQFRKTGGRQYAHYIHSFKPGEKLTHEQAHKLAVELSKKQFKGYEVLVATHKDKDHIHSHIIVNSVSYETGLKLHSSKKDLAEFKALSNKICEREGLSITEPKKDVLTSFDAKKYKSLEKGLEGTYKSYMLDLWKNVNSSMKQATNKEQFIQSMKDKGYEVNWSDTRKHITFVTPEGKKVRNSNLEKTFKNEKFSKEGLLNEFNRNGERLRARDKGKTEHISGNEREYSHGEQGGATNPSGINNSANKVARKDIGAKILFGGTSGANKVYSVGNDEPITFNEGHTQAIQGESARITKEASRERGQEDSRSKESKRLSQGNETRYKGNEGSKLQEDRGAIKDIGATTGEIPSNPFGNNESDKVSDFRSGENRQADFEGQGEAIHHSNGNNSRNDINDNRNVSSSDLLDQIVENFAEPLKRAEEQEKEKKLLAELKEKEKSEIQYKPRHRAKDFDRDI